MINWLESISVNMGASNSNLYLLDKGSLFAVSCKKSSALQSALLIEFPLQLQFFIHYQSPTNGMLPVFKILRSPHTVHRPPALRF